VNVPDDGQSDLVNFSTLRKIDLVKNFQKFFPGFLTAVLLVFEHLVDFWLNLSKHGETFLDGVWSEENQLVVK